MSECGFLQKNRKRFKQGQSVLVTAQGTIHTLEEATVKGFGHVCSSSIIKELPAVLLLGPLFEEHGCSYERHPGQPPHPIKNGRQIECKTDNHIPEVVPRVQASKHQTKVLDDRKRTPALGDHERSVEIKLPEWLQPFTEGLSRSSSSTDVSPADVAMPTPALPASAHPPAKPTSNKSGNHNVFNHFPKDPNCVVRRCTQVTKEVFTIGRTEFRLPNDVVT